MSIYELLNELKEFAGTIQRMNSDHSHNLQKIEQERRSSLSSNDRDKENIENELLKVQNLIAGLEKQILSQVEKNFTNNAYDELTSLLSYFNLQFEHSREVSLEKLKADLSEAYIKKSVFENKSIPDTLRQKSSIEEMFAQKQAIEVERFEKQKESLISKLRVDYGLLRKVCVENYSIGSIPQIASKVPEEINIGNILLASNSELKAALNEDPLKLPLVLDLKNTDSKLGGNLVIKIKTEDVYAEALERIMVGTAMRYLESFPCGSLKIGIFSSVFSSLQKLNAFNSAISKGGISILPQAVTNQQNFSSLLSAIKMRGDIINQKLLENECLDIYGLYNKGINTEPYQLIILQDSFREMSEENLRELYGCLTGYYRCGIRFIIIDTFEDEIYKNKSPLFKKTLAQILELCHNYSFNGGAVRDRNGYSIDLASVTNNINQQSVYDFCKKYCEEIGKKKSSSVSYEQINFGSDEESKRDWSSISIPVGLDEPNIWRIELNCLQKPPIANLVIGVPGTGKSTLIDSMILNGAIKYSPDELIFQSLDFKDGISSSAYTMDECKIPHVKVVSQNNKPEEASIILSNIMLESERRNEKFKELSKESGKQIKNIAEYNELVSTNKFNRKNMPRLVIVVDECQYLFEDEILAKMCEDIVRKCRAQGIHLILATQTLSRKMWSTIKFVDGRYCFEIAKDDAEQLLARKYVPMISTEVPKGSYMAFASNNSGLDCQKIKIAYDGGNMAKYAKKICNKWSDYQVDVVEIGDKSALYESVSSFKEKFGALSTNDELVVPLGENYTDHSLVTARFRSEKQSSMLLMGTNQVISDSICSSVLLAAQCRNLETYVIDASQLQSLRNFEKYFDNTNKVFISDEKDYLNYLSKVYQIYDERIGNVRKLYSPVVFIINAAQYITDLSNDAKYVGLQNEPLSKPILSDNPIERLRQQQLSRNTITSNKSDLNVLGKSTLFNLISNAYKVNIFICLSIDSIMATNDMGDLVFGFQQRNILRNNNYKILFNDNSDSKNIMEDMFKEKMLNGLNENMAFVSEKQHTYSKFRVIQYEM